MSVGEFGVYDIDVTNDCSIKTAVEPVNAYLAILFCTLILLALGALFWLVKWAVKKGHTAKIEKIYAIARRHIGYEVRLTRKIEFWLKMAALTQVTFVTKRHALQLN